MTQSSSSSPITVSSNINDNNYIDSQIGCGSGSFQNDGVLSNNDRGGGSGNTSETKFGFQRNKFRQNPLVETVQIYDQHVFLCYKNPQVWPPHVEAAEFDRLPRLLSVALLARKAQMKKQVCYIDFRLIGVYYTKMEGTVLWWLAPVMGGLPLLLWLLWSWNEIRWPASDIVGQKSLVVLNCKSHARLRSYVSNAINKPDALKKISKLVQPRIVASLHSCVEIGKIRGIEETKKGNKMIFSHVNVPGLVKGIRAQPINLPGIAYHHALQCRKKLMAIFKTELEKKKGNGSKDGDDLMDGLMRIKDEHGETLCDDEVLDNIISLVLAGYESTSLASMWALYYLAKYHDVLQKLREENNTVSNKKRGDFITSHILPKGWKVLVWLRCMHNDPNNFDNPMCFNRDRWNTRLTICEGHDGTETSNEDVLIFPDMIRYMWLTHFDVNTFVEEVFIKGSGWLLGTPEALRGSYICVCSHGKRDHRCGVCGPPLVTKFQEEIVACGIQSQVSDPSSPRDWVKRHDEIGNGTIIPSSTTLESGMMARCGRGRGRGRARTRGGIRGGVRQSMRSGVVADEPVSIFRDTGTQFSGTLIPSEAEAWFRSIEKALDAMKCPDDQGEADYWWDMANRTILESPILWSSFQESFFDQYFLQGYRDVCIYVLYTLEQGDMSVARYDQRFDELARYVPFIVQDEKQKKMKILRGLRPFFRRFLISSGTNTYREVLSKVLALEQSEAEDRRSRDARNPTRQDTRPDKGKAIQIQYDNLGLKRQRFEGILARAAGG
ncbi:hypothetical protein GIB67_035361 [Kingdonia uniflora]|uniref:Retrotransposon gag domain-containing protein n=1 Tax=Kingdonia uniflora TaxID=39325 RepID=A0A7J7MMH0_9MAGN|nr:hypothetical protein GIB67_035361 [Kingdonia uniflora]